MAEALGRSRNRTGGSSHTAELAGPGGGAGLGATCGYDVMLPFADDEYLLISPVGSKGNLSLLEYESFAVFEEIGSGGVWRGFVLGFRKGSGRVHRELLLGMAYSFPGLAQMKVASFERKRRQTNSGCRT